MKKKKNFRLFLTIALLSGSLSSTAYAATWYMEDGDVIVSASESGQTVSQNNNTIGDNDPTFTNRDSSVASDSTITIKTSDDATANITIEDINLKHSRNLPLMSKTIPKRTSRFAVRIQLTAGMNPPRP